MPINAGNVVPVDPTLRANFYKNNPQWFGSPERTPESYQGIGGEGLLNFLSAIATSGASIIPLVLGSLKNNSGGNVPGLSFGNTANSNILGLPGGGNNGGIDFSKILSTLSPELLKVLFPNGIPGSGTSNNNNPSSNTNQPQGNNGLMNILLPILATISGGLSNRSQQTTTGQTIGPSTTTTSPTYTTTGATTSQTNPNITPGMQSIIDNLTNSLNSLLTKDPDLTGYGATQIGEINNSYKNLQESRRSELAARGITGPAAENALGSIDNQRFGETVGIRNQLPLLSNQLRQQAITSAATALGSIPHGTTTQNSGQTNTSSGGTVTNSGQTNTGFTNTRGNVLGGATSGLTEILALLYGMGAFK